MCDDLQKWGIIFVLRCLEDTSLSNSNQDEKYFYWSYFLKMIKKITWRKIVTVFGILFVFWPPINLNVLSELK